MGRQETTPCKACHATFKSRIPIHSTLGCSGPY
jgi:protein-arginine kinase activator protein McsA